MSRVVWRDIRWGDGVYQISTRWEVRNKRTGQILRDYEVRPGKFQVTLSNGHEKAKFYVHILFNLAFCEDDEIGRPMVWYTKWASDEELIEAGLDVEYRSY
jgi:hypothetical protein